MRYIAYIPFIIREFFNGKNKDFSIEIKDRPSETLIADRGIKDEWDETLMKAEYLEEKDIDAEEI